MSKEDKTEIWKKMTINWTITARERKIVLNIGPIHIQQHDLLQFSQHSELQKIGTDAKNTTPAIQH